MKNSAPNSIHRYRWLIMIVVLLPVFSLLTGCGPSSASSSGGQLAMAPMAGMPAEVRRASVSVSDAYRFAVANPDALKNVPCYCGCGKVGHTSNYSCYVKDVKPSGEIVFDQHALGCGICVDIAQGVMKMTRDGKSSKEIRSAIDQTFAQYGPSNGTPVQ